MSNSIHSQSGPHCSFCGRSASEVEGEMARGPDVYICQSCIRESAALVGVRLRDGADDEQPARRPSGEGTGEATSADYGAAYLAIESLKDPLGDLIRGAYGSAAIDYIVAGTEWHRTHLPVTPKIRRAASRRVAEALVAFALKDLHRHH